MIVYYKRDDTSTWIDKNDEIKTTPFMEMPKEFVYEMFKGYKMIETDLRQFKSDLIRENEELKTFKYNFLEKFNNRTGIWLYFKSKATNAVNKFTFETIDEYEYHFIEDCPNGGSVYFNSEYKNQPTQCYGYDIKMFYPNLLCDSMLRLPLTKGIMKTLDTIPETFEYGIYKCKVICDDPNIKKLFAFSKKNTYTSISLNNALFLRDKKKYPIQIELINEPNNALIYENTIDSKAIFGSWLKSAKLMREKFPKNKLIKYLTSSLWGEIVRFNQKIVGSYSEIDIDEYFIRDEINYVDRDVIYLLPKKQPYKNELARLKPFLVSLGRYHMCNIILKNKIIDNIIRLQTDGIVLNKEQVFKGDYAPILEDKSTGLITWYNVNDNDRMREKRDN